jgi:multidrug transporter EmrE-like cation transporter
MAANYASANEGQIMHLMWLGIAIAGTVAYHIVLKLTPAGANPYLSLAVSYAVVTVAFAGVYLVAPGPAPLKTSMAALDWTALGLGVAIVFLDLALLMLYRVGVDLSLVQPITQSAGALALLLVGVAFFKDKLSAANIAGIALCMVGFWLISRK